MVNLFFLQVKFRSFLEILELLVFITVILKTVKKTVFSKVSKISKNDRNLTCKKKQIDHILPARFNETVFISLSLADFM